MNESEVNLTENINTSYNNDSINDSVNDSVNNECEKIYYSYDEIDQLCRSTAILTKNTFDPDIILAIGGGGLIPARIIRTVINKPIYVVSLSSYDENNNQIDNLCEIQWADFSKLKDKKILIVDEIDDTRKTLDYVVNKMKTEENILGSNIGIFVIHNKQKQKCKLINEINIKYYQATRSVPDKWIVYPWD